MLWLLVLNELKLKIRLRKSNCKYYEVYYIVCYMFFNDFVCGDFSYILNGFWFLGRLRGLFKVLYL